MTWSSALSGISKAIAHNTFTIPATTSKVSIIDWTIKKISQLDINNRNSYTYR